MASAPAPGSTLRNANGGLTAGVTIAVSVVMLALPSGVLAFATRFDVDAPLSRDSDTVADTPAEGPGTRLARGRSLLWDRGPEYPFTPAKNPNRPDRLVTVAVRLDSQALKAITVYGRQDAATAVGSNLPLAQSPFNLGVARGYHNFAQEITSSTDVHRPGEPDVSKFSIAPSARGDEPRDAPRVLFDDKINAGRAQHAFSSDRDDRVDLGGALKVTRNLDVTAGVRYSQDRERLLPLTDGKRDNQAVYVGTQLHF